MNIDEHLCGYDQVLDFFGFGDWHLDLPAGAARPELEDRLRRLPRLLPPALPAPEQLRARHVQQGDLHDVGSAPADDHTPTRRCSRCATSPKTSGTSTRSAAGCGRSSRTSRSPAATSGARWRSCSRARRPAPRGRSSTTTSRPSRPTSSGRRPWSRPTSSSASSATRTTPPGSASSGRWPAGRKRSVVFGRNEGGGQRFHHTLDELLAAGAATSRPPSA